MKTHPKEYYFLCTDYQQIDGLLLQTWNSASKSSVEYEGINEEMNKWMNELIN